MTMMKLSSHQFGKTIMMERMLREFTRANPNAIIAYAMPGGKFRIEKPISAADLVPELPAAEVLP